MGNANREYELIVRQEPKQARMCGIGTKGECFGRAFSLPLLYFTLLFFYRSLLCDLLCLRTFSYHLPPSGLFSILSAYAVLPCQSSFSTSRHQIAAVASSKEIIQATPCICIHLGQSITPSALTARAMHFPRLFPASFMQRGPDFSYETPA